MNPAPDPVPPTDSELADAGRTLTIQRPSAAGVRERLMAASTLLASLGHQPTEPSLVFSRGENAKVEAVPVGKGVTVGRGQDATLCIPDCADLSRRHFTVRPESGAWLLEDPGSRNGTMVDGTEGRITRRLLRDGDFIFAGPLMFLFVNPAD